MSQQTAEASRETGDHRGLVVLLALVALIGLLAGSGWLVIIAMLVATLVLHELGHYLTARLTGMKVTEFFIGFGPRIWSFRRGETEYGIKAIWAGAYVRIVGMNNLDEVDPADEPRAFRQQSYPRKLLVLVAGSGMHFVIALVVLFGVLIFDGDVLSDAGTEAEEARNWTVATVSPNSAATEAGLAPGDQLISLGGVDSTTFADLSRHIRQLNGSQVEIVYLRDGVEQRSTAQIGERLTAQGAAGIVGLVEGDRILAVEDLDNGGRPPTYVQMAAHARGQLGQPMDIVILDARTGEVALVEGAMITEIVSPALAINGFLGVSADYPRQRLGVSQAAGDSLHLVGTLTREVVMAIPNLVTDGLSGTLSGLGVSDPEPSGAAAARELELRRLDASHPDENRILSIYGVARIGAEAAEDGLSDVLILLVFVNIFIGVFNMIPLLPLDGGHVAVATYERIRSFGGRRHQVDAASLLPITYAVVALLVLIGGVALIRDILDPISFG